MRTRRKALPQPARGRPGELQVPWCLGAQAALRRRGRARASCAAAVRPREPGGALGSASGGELAAPRRHAGQLGQGRVSRAPSSDAGALAADLAAQPRHLLGKGVRSPRGPARDLRER